jgi:uncharacterized FlaG/YvyC family protein
MAAHATNRTNLATLRSDIATLRANAALATDQNSREELARIAKELDRVLDRVKNNVQGL